MSTEAMKLALEALEKLNNTKSYWWQEVDDDVTDQLLNAETALREALAEPATEESSAVQPAAQPQPEPVAWRVKWPAIGGGHNWLMVDLPLMEKEGFVNEALYTSPPAQRKPLTPDLEADTGYSRDERAAFTAGWEAAEAAHGIKGEA